MMRGGCCGKMSEGGAWDASDGGRAAVVGEWISTREGIA